MMTRQPTEGEKFFASYSSDKGFKQEKRAQKIEHQNEQIIQLIHCLMD
jgi:hypothetical protein